VSGGGHSAISKVSVVPVSVRSRHRILQEVMSNLVRHSGATLIDVELRREARRIVCTVRDDGRAPDRRQQRTQGIGLRTVADRLRTIGGGMRLERTDTGTTLTLEIAL